MFPKIGVVNPPKWMIWGYPYFWKHPYGELSPEVWGAFDFFPIFSKLEHHEAHRGTAVGDLKMFIFLGGENMCGPR